MKVHRWIARILQYLARLSGFEYALVVAIPGKEQVVTFASPGGAEWLGKTFADAPITFPAAVQAAQMQRRMFAVKLGTGNLDCSLPVLLDEKLQQSMMATLMDALVDRKAYPFVSTNTEDFREVDESWGRGPASHFHPCQVLAQGACWDGLMLQAYQWFPEGLEYESLDDWKAPDLEKLLIGMVEVMMPPCYCLHASLTLCITAAPEGQHMFATCCLCMQGNDVLTLLAAVHKGSVKNTKQWSLVDLARMRAVIQHYARLHKKEELDTLEGR